MSKVMAGQLNISTTLSSLEYGSYKIITDNFTKVISVNIDKC